MRDHILFLHRKVRPAFLGIVALFLFTLTLSAPHPARCAGKKVVLLPIALYADPGKAYLQQGLKSMFLSRLSGEGIEIVPEETLSPLLSDQDRQGIVSRERAEGLAAGLGADFAVFGSMTAIGGGYSLDLSILELKDGEGKVTNVSEAADENQFIPKVSDVVNQFRGVVEGIDIQAQRTARFRSMSADEESSAKGLFFKPTSDSYGIKPAGRISLRIAVMGIDTGDLDADGESELLVLGRDRLLVYRKLGEKAALKDTLKASLGEVFLKVSAGDMDGNGKPEIYVVGLSGERARTTVWEWDGKFNRLFQEMGHLQVLKDFTGERPLLLSQKSGMNNFFMGPISLMRYNGGTLSKAETLQGLTDAQFYTLTLFDFNKNGIPEFVGLGAASEITDETPIHIWDRQGRLLWRGKSPLGGTNNDIRVGAKEGQGDLPPRVALNSRLVVSDIDDDGQKEILAIKNYPMVEATLDFRVYIKSKLIAYKIKGATLVQSWSTRKINYCVTDIQTDGEKTIYMAAHKGKISNISAQTGRVMWFE